MKKKHKKIGYVGMRMLELIFFSAAILGIMWQGVDALSPTVPQFLMLYGVLGGFTCEIGARILRPDSMEKDSEKESTSLTERNKVKKDK